MNYGQFLLMLPEAALVLVLIIVFFADLFIKGERKVQSMGLLTTLLLCATLVPCFLAEPTSAFGDMYVTSKAANLMKLILTAGTAVVAVMAQPWLEGQIVNGKSSNSKLSGEFYTLLVSTLLGMYFMMSSGHFLMFFLGLEMASVPMACLAAFDKYKKSSAEAAAKYILVATFSSGVMLFGISFIYAGTGTLYYDGVRAALEGRYMFSPLMLMGLAFFFSGLGFKLSLVPFHFWTADTYEGAPTPVTGYLSVISKGAAALTLLIVLEKAFAPMSQYYQVMLWVVIILSITIANLFAIRQNELKRFMAFSSISQAGYIMLAVIGNNFQFSTAALIFYVLVYIVANLAVFTVINVVEHRGQPTSNNQSLTSMSTYDGFYQTNPKLAFLMTLALFSLAGIPPFAGMFSKFFVFMAGVAGHEAAPFWSYFVVFIALINTVVSLYYYLLIVKAMYIKKTDSPLPTFQSDFNTKVALAVCTAGIALFGIASCIYDWIYASAAL